MDNKTAREILSAYRPNGADAQDDNFHEALLQCRNDPGMHDWFAGEHRFDQAAATALAAFPVPRSGKDRLLQGSLFDDVASPESAAAPPSGGALRTWLRWSYGIAALLLISFGAWQIFQPDNAAGQPASAHVFSIAGLVNDAMPLSYRNDDPRQVMRWLSEREAPVPVDLPAGLGDAAALGCRVFSAPGGGKITLLCLLNNGEVVHFFVFDDKASDLVAGAPLNTWWEEDGWNIYSFMEGEQRIALATQGDTSVI